MIQPGRPMDRETLKAVERELHERLSVERNSARLNNYGLGCCDGIALAIQHVERMLEQLRDAPQRGSQVQNEDRDRLPVGVSVSDPAIQSDAPRSDLIPAPVGGQTPTEPDEETPLSAYNRGRLAVCTELTLAVQQFNDDDTKRGAGQLCEAISPWLLDDSETATPPPPGAPPAFTRDDIERMANEACQLILQARDIHTRDSLSTMREMLLDSAATVPAEDRKETR